MEFHASRKVRDRETRSPARETRALPGSCAQIVGLIRIFRRERFNMADFDVDFLSSLNIERRTSSIESVHGYRT